MADQPHTPHPQHKWWQGAPGVISASAALLAAASGLIGGLNQLGVFDRFKHPAQPPAASAVHLSDTLAGTASSGAPRRSSAPHTPAPRPRAARPSAEPPAASTPSRPAPAPAPADTATRVPAPAGSTSTPPAAAPPAPAPAQPATAPAPTGPTGSLPPGTTLELASTTRVCSTSSQPGDRFAATVVVPVTGQGGAAVPIGSTALLETTRESPPSFIGARPASLDVGGKSFPIAGTARPQREFTAGTTPTSLGVGACIPAGGRVTVTLTSPVQFSK
jgi:hypothetical protein